MYNSVKAPFIIVPLDITVTHTDYEISVPRGAKYLQAWCDGVMDGIYVVMGQHGNAHADLNKHVAISMPPTPPKVMISNDVRAGRSRLEIYWVFTEKPLNLTLGGQDISLAELAVRTGGQIDHDRRGELLFESRQKSLKEFPKSTTTGIGAGITLSTQATEDGKRMYRLVTGQAINNYAYLEKEISFPFLTKFGLAAKFNISELLVYYDFMLSIQDGTTSYIAIIRLNTVNAKLQYFNPAAGYTDFASGLGIYTGVYLMHYLKFVANLLNKKYVRVIWDNNIYDLSTFSMYSAPLVTAPIMDIRIGLTTSLNKNEIGYVGNIKITQNEP